MFRRRRAQDSVGQWRVGRRPERCQPRDGPPPPVFFFLERGIFFVGVDFHDKGFCASAAEGCLFADFGGARNSVRVGQSTGNQVTIGSLDAGALHNVRFEADLRRFDSFRLGDGTNVKGERKA